MSMHRPHRLHLPVVLSLAVILVVGLAPASWAHANPSGGFTSGDDPEGDDVVLTVLEPRYVGDSRSMTSRPSDRATSRGTGGTSLDKLKYGSGCQLSCITSAVAYARRAGAELVVTTDSPATIRIMLWGDGFYSEQQSAPGQYGFAALFADLEAGTTYSARAVVLDSANQQHLADGSFTTLNRHVEVKTQIVELLSTYGSSDKFSVFQWANGAYQNEFGHQQVDKVGQFLILGTSTTGSGPSFELAEVDRHLDLRVGVLEHSISAGSSGLCEAPAWWGTLLEPFYASWSDCFASAVALPTVPGGLIHLDIPVVSNSWVDHTVYATLSVNHGASVPSELSFTVPVTIHVTYS